MKFNNLNTGRKKSAKRVGRGIAAGQGKTAGRGTKGYGARTGSKARPGFMGGQNPIMQQLPKLPGFKSHHTPMENVFTGQLNSLKAKTVTVSSLAEAGLVSSPYVRVKLLAKGDVSKALTVELQAASGKAVELLENAGGSFKAVARSSRPASKPKKEA
jgi:large subunit ribosomal protein L15